MLMEGFESNPHFTIKTSGSTGISVTIYYDQSATILSSAITGYARSHIGHKHWKPKINFVSKFPEMTLVNDGIIVQVNTQ